MYKHKYFGKQCLPAPTFTASPTNLTQTGYKRLGKHVLSKSHSQEKLYQLNNVHTYFVLFTTAILLSNKVLKQNCWCAWFSNAFWFYYNLKQLKKISILSTSYNTQYHLSALTCSTSRLLSLLAACDKPSASPVWTHWVPWGHSSCDNCQVLQLCCWCCSLRWQSEQSLVELCPEMAWETHSQFQPNSDFSCTILGMTNRQY